MPRTNVLYMCFGTFWNLFTLFTNWWWWHWCENIILIKSSQQNKNLSPIPCPLSSFTFIYRSVKTIRSNFNILHKCLFFQVFFLVLKHIFLWKPCCDQTDLLSIKSWPKTNCSKQKHPRQFMIVISWCLAHYFWVHFRCFYPYIWHALHWTKNIW